MPLVAANFTIALTPSFILNGHFPDGNDGTGAIPLTWATSPGVPDFTNKEVGTAFSVDLFTLYLTQSGGAVATIHTGSLTGGWTLSSSGVLSYSRIGTGSGTIQVRATIAPNSSDSNFFSYSSIPVVVSSDTLAPTKPTGLRVTAVTASTIVVACDAPSDPITSLIPSDGLKEVQFFRNGFSAGTTSITGGKHVLLTEADVGGGSAQRWVGGWYTAVPPTQRSSWIASPGASINGPIAPGTNGAPGTTGIVCRHNWIQLEPSPNTFNFNSMTQEYNICANLGVLYFVLLIGRTFSGNTPDQNPAPTDLQSLTYSFISGIDGGAGWQVEWWMPEIVNRFGNLIQAVGKAFDNLPYFGGIATQETSIGSTLPSGTGYTLKGFKDSMITGSANIKKYSPKGRHMWYFNFIHAGGMSDLGEVAVEVVNNGGIVGGPNLPIGGPDVNNQYPIYRDVAAGVGSAAHGTAALTKAGPTMSCMQGADFDSRNPSDNPAATVLQRFQYATHRAPYASSPLSDSILIPDWHKSGPQTFKPNVTDLIATNPTFGPYVPPPSMAPGSILQTGVDYVVTGAGTGIGPSSDQFSVGRVACNGDFVLIAKLANVTGTDTTHAVAGISIRESTIDNSTAAYLVATPSTLRARYRGSAGSPVTNLLDVAGQGWTIAKWYKLVRAGTLFSWFYSLDGNSWLAMGTANIGMVSSVFADLIASSGLTTNVKAHFEQINVQSLSDVVFTFTGLATATPYTLSANTRDNAGNSSNQGATIKGTTS